MKISTVEYVLRNKLLNFVDSLGNDKDISLPRDVLNNCIVSGGAVSSMLIGEKVNDFDIYLTDVEVAKRLIHHFMSKYNDSYSQLAKTAGVPFKRISYNIENTETGVKVVSNKIQRNTGIFNVTNEIDEDEADILEETGDDISALVRRNKVSIEEKFHLVLLTENALTLSDKVQIIIRFIGKPEEVHKYFDFAHCTNYFDGRTSRLITNETALTSVLTKDLVYIGSKYPISSLFRTRKFIKRGWSITAAQMFKIILNIYCLDLLDEKLLRDQLMGVDYIYFKHFMDIFEKAKKEKKPKTKEEQISLMIEILDGIL